MKSYENLLELKVFNFKDACDNTGNGNKNTTKTILKYMQQKGYIKKVKHNLYVVCDIEHKMPIPDQYRIASKITEDSYIGYHSALEYYGVKNQVFYNVYVLSNKKFEEFEFEGYTYTHINNKYNFGIEQVGKVKVTDKERTIIDCIDKTGLTGGNEELYLCFELLQGINGETILEYLKQYNSKKLYAKVGFILETFKKQWRISDKVIEECRSNVSGTRYYFDEETKNMKHKGINKWNLIVPEIFINRGGSIYW